jgi:DNA-binding beta-propeller fold protein YncE
MNIRITLAAVLALSLHGGAYGYDTIRFHEPIKADEMVKPVAAASYGDRLYVLDEKKSALLIYSGGKLIKVVGRPGSDKTSFRAPQGVTVGPDGRVYVADTGNSRIQILGSEGDFLSFFGEKGSEPGKLSNPESVAVGVDGRVYVADTGNDRIQVFTREGILLFSLNGNAVPKTEPGYFSSPSKVALDPSDNVYVLDQGNDRIQKFDASAKPGKEFSLLGIDFAVDQYGFLYVLDASNGKVIEQDPSGAILGKFGSLGKGTGQFKKPDSLTVAADGSVVVMDTGNNRIQRIDVANKLKTVPLPANLATKLSVSGPSRSWPVPASVIAALGQETLYAYLPKEGQFVILDENGAERKRFGAKTGKTPSVTRDTKGFAASQKMGLYVSDTPGNRVQQFSLDGEWIANHVESTGFFDSNKKEGRVKDPRGVAINDEGTIYVADAGNTRVDALSPEGVFLFSFGPSLGSYKLEEPAAIAWDKSGFIYVADKSLKRVFKCEPSGALVATLGEPGSKPGQFESPVAVAFDGNNYVYVLDDVLRRVSVYSKDGRWMTDLFAGGGQERELTAPVSIAIQGDRLVIADKGKGKIASFDLHPSLAAPIGITTSTKDGLVSLSWREVNDSWTAGYRVLRSTNLDGPWKDLGLTSKARFEDNSVVPPELYYYKVGTEAKTKDLGPLSRPVEVSVAGVFNKSPVEISTVTIGNIFPANYKWYLKNPVGSVVLTNNVNVPFENVKLTFRLKDFMDFGYDTEISRLEPQQRVDIPLIATLNNKILEVTEDTPIQAEFTLTYFEGGKSQVVSVTKPLRVYSRNAITWENPERIANFITPKDPPILEFMRETLRQAPKNPRAQGLGSNLLTAIHLWDSLSESGVQFFSNPNSPYETVSEDPNFPVDYTQFPRETLKRKTGQCDDLVTLLISMLDGAKVGAAILDYPGHMALMFDTETNDPLEAGLPESELVRYDDSLWVPVEATLIGQPFHEAYRKALYAYKTEAEKGKVTVLDVRKAWQSFEPATMPASDWTAEVPKPEQRQKRFVETSSILAVDRYRFLKKHYEGLLKTDGKNADARLELGLLEYQNGDRKKAAEEFNKVLAFDSKNAAALNNVGNIAYVSGDYAAAEAQFLKAAEAEPEDSDIWLNLLKTAVRMNNGAKAKEYARTAYGLEKSLEPVTDSLIKKLK